MRIGMGMGLHDLLRRVAAGVAQSTLLQGLISYWPLNETSGVRYDVVGTNHLTDNNTVTYIQRGPVGTGASFIKANSERLTHPTLANDLDWSQGVTLLMWHKGINEVGKGFAAFGASIYQGQHCFGVNDQGSSNDVLFLQMELGDYAPKLQSVQGVDGPQQPGTFGWHLLAARYKASTKTGLISIDGKTPGETSALAAHPTFDQATKSFQLGCDNVAYITSRMACVGVWNRTLSDAEIVDMMNGGNAKRYSDLSNDNKVGLVSYWNLDEVSGVRYDSHGTNHLTDNNTVGSVNSGPPGVVADFVATNKILRADNFTMPSTYTVSGWFEGFDGYPGTPPNGGTLIYMGNSEVWNASVAQNIQFGLNNGGYLGYAYAGDGTDYIASGGFYSNWVSYTEGVRWHFFVAEYDEATRIIRLWIDGVLRPTGQAAASIGTCEALPSPRLSEAGSISVGGSYGAYGGGSTNRGGRVGIWERALSANERASLFNGGMGKFYSELTDGEKTGLKNYWDLTEMSGTRSDSHGSDHLYDQSLYPTGASDLPVKGKINAGDAMDGAAANFTPAASEYLSLDSWVWPAEFTMQVWVRSPAPTVNYQTQMWITNNDAGGSPTNFSLSVGCLGYTSGWAWPGVDFGFTNSIADYIRFTTDASWHQVLITYSGSEGRLYLDNVEHTDSPVSVSGWSPSNGIYINRAWGYSGSLNSVPVQHDEIAFWARVLTADERAELFNLGRGKYYGFE